MDRKDFLKLLGLGTLGTSIPSVDLDKVFSPAIQDQIDTLKTQLTHRINNYKIEFEWDKPEVSYRFYEVDKKMIFGWHYNECFSGVMHAESFLSKWYNQRWRKKPFTEFYYAEICLAIFERSIDLAHEDNPGLIDLYTKNKGMTYLLMNQFDKAQKEFEKISCEKHWEYGPLCTPKENMENIKRDLYDPRGYEFPSDFQFNYSNADLIKNKFKRKVRKPEELVTLNCNIIRENNG